MEISKKQLLILGGLLAFCVLIVLYVSWDKDRAKEVDHQLDVAEKDLEKQERKVKKEVEDILGYELPTENEVARLIASVGKLEDYSEVMNVEYGKNYGDKIYNAYINGQLPSNKDTEMVKAYKLNFLHELGTKDYYTNIINVTNDFIGSPPYSTLQKGFTEISPQIGLGYITMNPVITEYAEKGYEEFKVTLLAYISQDMTVKDFEETLSKLEFKMNNATVPALNKALRDSLDKTITDTPLTAKNISNVNYLDIFYMDWSGVDVSEMIMSSHTVVPIYLYWVTPSNNLTNETQTLSVKSHSFELSKIASDVKLPILKN